MDYKKYYLSLENIVLKSDFNAINFIYDNTIVTDSPSISLDVNMNVVNIKYSNTCTYKSLEEYIERKVIYNGNYNNFTWENSSNLNIYTTSKDIETEGSYYSNADCTEGRGKIVEKSETGIYIGEVDISTDVTGGEVKINKSFWEQKNGIRLGVFNILYDTYSASWKLNNTVINLGDYGIIFSGTPALGNSITVTYSKSSEVYRLIGGEGIVYKVEENDYIDITQGKYILYSPLDINGFKIIISKEGLGYSISQYIIDNTDFDDSITTTISNNNFIIICKSDVRLKEYINKINESNLFYILTVPSDYIINSVSTIVTNCRANKINVISSKSIPLVRDSLFIETADYLATLILTLARDYPNIQFYNNTQDENDSAYQERIFYKGGPEVLSNDIYTSVVFKDPIYGEVIRAIANIDFEYKTLDIRKYNKRKFDFAINRFISDHTSVKFTVPDTSISFPFTVIWDRSEVASEANIQKGTQLDGNSKDLYSFRFNSKLLVTIYRMNKTYPAILTKVINSYAGKNSKSNKIIEEEIPNF